MRGSIVAIAVLGTVCGSLLGIAPRSARADVHIGGDTEALFLFDLEEFAALTSSPGSAFVLLTNEELGISFGEKLVGQVNIPEGDFDFVTGTPTAPLAIDIWGDAAIGVNVLSFYSTVIDGLGPLGFPNPYAVGDGALTVLFDRDQSVIGFDVVGTNGGILDLQFFDRSGNLLDQLELHDLSSTSYVFTSDDENLAAITMNNLDHGGVAYDNFRFIPGTGTVATPLACSLGGSLLVQREGDVTNVALQAEFTTGSDPDSLTALWTADCPEGSFDSVTSTTASLQIDTSVGCQTQCDVLLTVDDGFETATCTTTVTVLYGTGVNVEVLSANPGRSDRGRRQVEPLSAVTVAVYDSSSASCVHQQMRAESGISRHTMESIVASCTPAGATQTDTNGLAFLDLLPGQYVVIASIDLDLDGLPDSFSGRPVGHLNCGQRKSRRIFLRQETD